MGIFQAGQEKVVDREQTERFFGTLKSPKMIKIYPNDFHEILNEIDRKEVMNDMLAWINQNLQNRP